MGDPAQPASGDAVAPPAAGVRAEQDTNRGHIGDTYEVPTYEAHLSFAALKDRIRHHYELASDYYYSLWGQHIHHAYFQSAEDTKETGQVNLINLMLSISEVQANSTVLDVGCGIGGTTRHLARELGCSVTGITISGRQVAIANRLTAEESEANPTLISSAAPKSSIGSDDDDTVAFMALGAKNGKVRFLELDAEKMESRFKPASFDAVWISEALSHFPDKPLFFRNAARVLRSGGGKLVIADWFKADHAALAEIQGGEADIKLIEDGMLLPPLKTQAEYVQLAEAAGLIVLHAPKDISNDVAKTWDISWQLISSPSLWAFAISQGRDGLAFLQAFRAMRSGYASGAFRYAVMAFEKM
ncbi:uncharacterized protein A1O9_08303 [Exophiala aquamarina CBS 119918]|uniref:Methyltransferase type 11 domain-containing protein n=1 Tax=Exophiala aquamarina CBS 119918 TaxID=1182545 RepID=A0A072P8D5_9EURO|nr:uncharacterized protein A1O9_08303 [Exophiala aquamarina CBS 119918]KEF55553.1 hypothetical protein A1O9_08303 [Exophiala aquamarina CBS 119918]